MVPDDGKFLKFQHLLDLQLCQRLVVSLCSGSGAGCVVDTADVAFYQWRLYWMMLVLDGHNLLKDQGFVFITLYLEKT